MGNGLKSKKHEELTNECDFRTAVESELAACCNYEYLRESATLRDSFRYNSGLDVPRGINQGARKSLAFVLIKAGWEKAAANNEAPLPWKLLDPETKEKIVRWAERCLTRTRENWKSHPPWLASEFLPGHDPVELERQVEKWKKTAYYDASIERRYFFGVFRLDETYNETEAAEAFKEWFRGPGEKTRGGGGLDWRALLNRLAVMRIWKRERNQWKRLELVAKLCGYKGCMNEAKAYKQRCKEGGLNQVMSNAAQVEMSSARKKARVFFQKLFPGEEPLSY
jgi:hypothetical protein